MCVSVCLHQESLQIPGPCHGYWEPVNTPDMNRHGSLLCVSVVALLSRGLGQGVAGAVADPREGLLAGQGSHSIHPITHRPH